jgi:lysyl-tRNA synthetase class 2
MTNTEAQHWYLDTSFVAEFIFFFLRLRSTAVEELKQNGAHPYPHKFHVTTSLTHFLEQYASLKVASLAMKDTNLADPDSVRPKKPTGKKNFNFSF